MSRAVLICCVLLSAIAGVGPGSAVAGPRPSGAQLRFGENPEYFGKFFRGEVFTRRVAIHNDGDATLEIRRVTPKCSCAEIVDFSRKVEPGAEGFIEMRIVTRKIAVGRFEKDINVFSNDASATSRGGRAIYFFRIEVQDAIAIEPDPTELRGLFDQPKSGEIRVRPLQGQKIVGLWSKSRMGHFEPAEARAGEAGAGIVPVSAPAVEAPGNRPDMLELEIEFDDGKRLVLEQPVAVVHHLPVVASPDDVVRFENDDTDPLLVDGAPPVRKTVEIRAVVAGLEFELSKVSLEKIPDGKFTIEQETVEPGRCYRIHLTLPRYVPDSYLSGDLVVSTTAAAAPEIRVKVFAKFGKTRPGG